MKKILLIGALVLIAIGAWFLFKTPEGSNPLPGSEQDFDVAFSMQVNDIVRFPDGLTVQLQEINDSRCKPGVQCIWAGELSARLLISNDVPEIFSSEVRLGTMNDQTVSARGHVFTLSEATETSITLVVSQAKATP